MISDIKYGASNFEDFEPKVVYLLLQRMLRSWYDQGRLKEE